MTYPEPPSIRTGKAIEHQKNALKGKGNDISNAEIKPSNRKELVGYRFQSPGAIRSGRAGVFYTRQAKCTCDKKFTLEFNNILEFPTRTVEPFVGLPAECLVLEWFPGRDRLDWEYRARLLDVEEDGYAMDIDVAREAIRRGYDGIKYGEFEIQDLKPLT